MDPAIVDRVSEEAGQAPGVRAVEAPQVRWLGHRLVADITIDVNADTSVHEGHMIATAVRDRLIAGVKHVDEVHVHVHPND